MELVLHTFADVGAGLDPAQRLRDLIEEIKLADQVGLDVFGVGRRGDAHQTRIPHLRNNLSLRTMSSVVCEKLLCVEMVPG